AAPERTDLSEGSLATNPKQRVDAVCAILIEAYETVLRTGKPRIFGPGIDVSCLISTDGRTKWSFPLPEGASISGSFGIALPTPCSSPLVELVEQSVAPAGVWVTFSA
ncbi:MAG: hypothetical protein ACK55I_32980, partial [bacterium]